MRDLKEDLAAARSYLAAQGQAAHAETLDRLGHMITYYEAHQRAPKGHGTKVDPNAPLTWEEARTYEILTLEPKDYRTVREVQKLLVAKDWKRNYQQVQRTLSRLLGRGLLDVFSPDELALRYRLKGTGP